MRTIPTFALPVATDHGVATQQPPVLKKNLFLSGDTFHLQNHKAFVAKVLNHNYWPGFFHYVELIDFAIARASKAAGGFQVNSRRLVPWTPPCFWVASSPISRA